MSAALLLTLYVTTDTTRALLVFGALHSGVELAPSALTCGAEVLKLLVAVVGVLSTTPAGQPRFLLAEKSPNESLYSSLRPYLRFAIPASLYGINNVLYLTGLKITSPALLQVCVLTKLPLTALLHHLVIKRRRSQPMWISLGVLTFGLVLAGSPEAIWDPSMRGSIQWADLISGPVIGLTVGVVSACSSVYTELALKENIGFWQAQTYLYFWGTLFAGFAAFVSSSRSPPTDASSTIASLPAFTLVVTVTALTGLVVALILRQRDNLVKLVGSSLCITTVFVLQHLFFPVTDGLDFRTTFGIGVLTLATWTYNHYKEIGDGSNTSTSESTANYVELSTSEQTSPLASKDSLANSGAPIPDTPGSSFSTDSPVFPPTSTSLSLSPDIYTPTPTRLVIGTALVLVIASLTSLQATSGQDRRTVKDLRGYFKGRKLGASSWSLAGENENRNCLEAGRQVAAEEEWYADPDLVLANAGCPIYPLPDEGLITHLFWSGERWRTPTFSLATDSWLATQDTSANNRLIWWYETHPPPASFVQHYSSPSSPFREIVSFQSFNESMGSSTCLASMREWSDLDYRKEVEMPSMTRKELIKLLILERFGGIWMDVDTVVLKSLNDVARIGPSVVTDNDYVDRSLVISGPVWGSAGHKMLETACELPFGTAELVTKFPGLRLKAGPAALYSEGVARLCEQEGCGLSSLPASMVLVPSTLSPCQPNSSPSLSSEYLATSYFWAPEMLARSDDDACWDAKEETLIGRVRKRVDEILQQESREGELFKSEGGALFSRARRRGTGDAE